MADKDYSDEVKDALRRIFVLCMQEDEAGRITQLRTAKRNEEYWRGIQYLFWDQGSSDWRLPPEELLDQLPKVINIYKAHGESIIAALSASLPYVRFYPEDADNAQDLATAKAYTSLSELIQKRNKATLLFVKSLFILFNQQFVASYNYSVDNEKYGTYQIPVIKTVPVSTPVEACPECGQPQMPDQTGLGGFGGLEEPQPGCQSCGYVGSMMQDFIEEEKPMITKYETLNKAREIIDVFGPLFVKIPLRCRKQEDCGYVILSMEQHYALVKDMYPKISEEVTEGATVESFGRYARRFSEVDYAESNQVTVHRCWFRPWLFNIIGDNKLEIIAELKKEFPQGCRVTLIESGSKGSELFAEAVDEDLDDHWTISVSGVSPYLHADPVGDSLIPMQEITNDLSHLTLETIRHGIPLNFATPDVLDFEEYQSHEARPGDIVPALPGYGQRSIGEGFHSLQTATLSKEVQYFSEKIEQGAQFVVGSFPSIYGGPQEGGGTLGEYAMSKSQALQRLSLLWKMLNDWWADTMRKSVDDTVELMRGRYDERDVVRQNNSFVNVWVRQSDVIGTIGHVVSETSDTFPMTSSQKMDLMVKLIEFNNEMINGALFHPENSQFVATVLGAPDLFIPGVDQRSKQYREIQEMRGQTPQDGGFDEMGQPIMMSSCPIDPDVDEHEIHVAVLKAFLCTEVGQDAKTNDPGTYLNWISHLKEHLQIVQQQMMEQAMQQAAMNPAPTEEEAPVEK